MPEGFQVAGLFSLREILVRQRTVIDGLSAIWSNAFTLAITQMSAPADSLTEVGRLWAIAAASVSGIQHFNYRNDATFTISTSQPVVMARCEETIVDLSQLNGIELNFPVLSSLQLTGTVATDNDATLTMVLPLNDSATLDVVISLLSSKSSPGLLWFDSSEMLQITNSSINVIAIFLNTLSTHAPTLSQLTHAKHAVEVPGACHIPAQFTPIPLFGMSNYRS